MVAPGQAKYRLGHKSRAQHPPGPRIREMRGAIQVLSQHGLCKQRFGNFGLQGFAAQKAAEKEEESTWTLDKLIVVK